uniref:Uncharacterized protein n=2 Tax=Tetraselmis sp. GSL018 TaxID=582737 RepID=A0A061S8C5_9CHLO|eukprot:CAMPEP_0177600594 /NCGR_PEP_ID=MMETSP0419_2-20121207/13739_1 /TAXON_ID=582737 /ORGANISM="Tetraselmis sp., Strain GSL018" /LENGTH=104 /DNA_ID=CAMNT_0019093663 /DNA_START=346 /DNA_END=660 /DNA_ORIENTATION=-
MAELSQHPRFFSMSLEKRIAPRVLYMMSRGVDVPSTPLNKILVYGDQKFAERTVGRPLEDFEAFLPSWHLSQAWQGWADVTGVEGEQKQCHGQSVGAPKASASM